MLDNTRGELMTEGQHDREAYSRPVFIGGKLVGSDVSVDAVRFSVPFFRAHFDFITGTLGRLFPGY